VIKRAGREMLTVTQGFIGGDYWYDKQCKRKKREVKLALNEYKKKSDGENRNKYWKCRREYVNLSDNKKQRWQEINSEKMNYMIKHRDTRKNWTTLRKPLKKEANTEYLEPDSYLSNLPHCLQTTMEYW
jgi:hypothetical protein